MSDNRNRIIIRPLDARPAEIVPKTPPRHEAVALIWRGEEHFFPDGLLVRSLASGSLAQWNGRAMKSIDSRKAEAALEGMDGSASPDEAAQIATMLKEWRDAADISVSRAAIMLGVPARTIEGIEQGRGFRYPRLLVLALLSFRAD